MMKGAGMVVEDSMSNLTSGSNDASISSGNRQEIGAVSLYPQQQPPLVSSPPDQSAQPTANSKKKRNLPGNPDPEAEVVALSPRTLVATNRFVCEVCNKGFQRDQNLQLHRRGHNLPWKLKQRSNKEVIRKKVYICPETTCIHHDPSRALGDLTGIKKHFSRKHGEKKWKCEKCSKRYAVQSDWKAHSKICGTREYRCDCGTLFSRRDSFITHRAFCDALAVESARAITSNNSFNALHHLENHDQLHGSTFSLKPEQLDQLQDQPQPSAFNNLRPPPELPPWLSTGLEHAMIQQYHRQGHENAKHDMANNTNPSTLFSFQAAAAAASSHMSATALLQKAAQMGVTATKPSCQPARGEEEVAAATAGAVATTHQATHLISATATTTAAAGLMSSTSYMRAIPTTDHGGVLMGMVNSQLGFEGSNSPFGGENFQGMLLSSRRNNNKVIGSGSEEGVVGGRGNNVINDGLTRDFLGLKAFPPPPPRGFLNLDDLHQINGSSFDDQQNHHNPAAPW